MNIEELAQVLDGLLKGLGSGLKEKEKKELAALAGMFRRFSNQSINDFVKSVEGSFSKERNSVQALVERIKTYKQGTGEPIQELQASLKSCLANDLKKLLAALGMKAGRTKGDNLKLLQSFLTSGQAETLAASTPVLDVSGEVDRAFAQYQAIKADLPAITVEEMRSRFAGLAVLSKPVLAGVLSKLGYPADGPKETITAQLLDNLTSIKISIDQTKRIGL
jgi:hypothetical protein